jgi:hypothetical protein
MVFLLLILAMLVENILLALAGDQRQVERNLSTRSYTEEAEETLEALHATERKP